MIYTLIRNPILCFHRAISLSVVKMVYCVVYNCSTCSNVEKNVSFFGFPKDNACKKIWIHYCHRKDFIVTKHSRICGKHFSPNQYSRYPPRLAELGYPNTRAQMQYPIFHGHTTVRMLQVVAKHLCHMGHIEKDER